MSHPGPTQNPSRAVLAVGIAVALAAGAMLVVAFAPLQRSTSVVVDTAGHTTTSSASQSLLASQGAGVLVPAAVPVALAIVPLMVAPLHKRRLFRALVIMSTTFVGLFVLATGFSIGLLYAPALAGLIVATAISADSGGTSLGAATGAHDMSQ